MWYIGFYLHWNTRDVVQWFLPALEHWGCGTVVFTCVLLPDAHLLRSDGSNLKTLDTIDSLPPLLHLSTAKCTVTESYFPSTLFGQTQQGQSLHECGPTDDIQAASV